MSTIAGIPSFGMPPLPIRRFTVDEYHRMIDAGILTDDDRVELLEGWIVSKMTRKPPHDVAIQLIHEMLRQNLPPGWSVRGQSAVTTADSEPEPDLAAVRGSARTYLSRHPGAADIGLLIEVADSSLGQDRHEKGRIYARAGIAIYWIVNLVDNMVEVYTNPTGPAAVPAYRDRADYAPGMSVPLVLDGQAIAEVAVTELLP